MAQVDFQGIIDLVGDELRDVFDTQDMSIRLYDQRTGQVSSPYDIEHGRRLDIPLQPLRGMNKIVVDSLEPLVINENMAEAGRSLGLPLGHRYRYAQIIGRRAHPLGRPGDGPDQDRKP